MSSLPDPELLRAFRNAVLRHFDEEIARERRDAEARKAAVIPKVRDTVVRARGEGRCGKAWLFGSYAWGEPGERSDVDVLVDECDDAFALASLIGRACGRDVHVIEWREAPTSLRQRVLAEGMTL